MRHQRMRRSALNKNKITTYLIWTVLVIAVVVLIWVQNNLVLTQNYIFMDSDLPKCFVGYKIVHVTDICNSGVDIVSKVKKLNPDIIVVSGGYEDDNGDYKKSVKTINKLSKIADTYYVYGPSDETDCLDKTSATNLCNSLVELEPNYKAVDEFLSDNYGDGILKKAKAGDETSEDYLDYIEEELENCKERNEKLGLIGLDRYVNDDDETLGEEALEKSYELLLQTDAEYTVGIIGNAKTLPEVAKSRLDLAFTGGTYGTTFLSKEYTKGKFGIKDTQVFFCGGIGTRYGVKRVFNLPEIQCITLTDGTIQTHNMLERFIGLFWSDVGTVFDNDGGFKLRRRDITEADKR